MTDPDQKIVKYFTSLFLLLQIGNILCGQDIHPISDQYSCSEFILPLITGTDLDGSEAYYSGPSGSGDMYVPGDTIRQNVNLFAYVEVSGVSDEECFSVFLVERFDIGNDTTIVACDFFILPPLANGIHSNSGYYTEPGGKGTFRSPGTQITASIDLFAYYGSAECVSERKLKITIGSKTNFILFRNNFCPYMVIDEELYTTTSNNRFFRPDSLWIEGSNGSAYSLKDSLFNSGTYTSFASLNECISQFEFDVTIAKEITIVPIDDTAVCSDSILLPLSNREEVTRYYYANGASGLSQSAGSYYNNRQPGTKEIVAVDWQTDCRDSTVFEVNFLKTAQSTEPLFQSVCSGQIYPLTFMNAHEQLKFTPDTIIPAQNNPYVNGMQFDTRNIIPGSYDFYLISNSDPLCMPLSDTTLFTLDVKDFCMVSDTILERCQNYFVARYYPPILGGTLYDANYNPIDNFGIFHENIDQSDLMSLGSNYVHYIINDQNGFSDTARITISIIENEILLSVSDSVLCEQECVNVYTSTDLLGGERVFASILNEGFLISSFKIDTTINDGILTICYDRDLDDQRPANIIAEDTIFLESPNFEYLIDVLFSAPNCESGHRTFNIRTSTESINFVNSIICPGESIIIEGQYFDENNSSGRIVLPGRASNGCDSIIIADLEVNTESIFIYNNIFNRDDTVIINCNAYYKGNEKDTVIFNGISETCDSTIIINFQFLGIEERFYIIDSLCFDEIATYHGFSYSNAGSYIDTLLDKNGEDSIIVNVEIGKTYDCSNTITCLETTGSNFYIKTMSVSLCEGELFYFFNDTLSSPGLYEDTIKSVSGPCDTIVMVDLEILSPAFRDTQTIQVLNGQTFEIDDEIFTSSAAFYTYYSSNNSCDSILTTVIEFVDDLPPPVFYSPTIFSPNGDNLNDQFYVVLPDNSPYAISDINIYSRWGDLLWTYTSNLNETWDGKIQNNDVIPGVYMVLIEFKKPDGKTLTMCRDITVIR